MTAPLLKILAICLMSSQKYKAYAVYNGEQLVIADVQPITGIFGLWRDPLIAEILQKKADGFVVIVEERTDNIAKYATQYLLESASDGDSRTNLYETLDWYFAMHDVGNIVFNPSVQKFSISAGGEGSKVDKRQDEKGRTAYSVDWKAFHGGYRAVLLCVVAAMEEPVSERYLSEMFPASSVEEETHPMFRLHNALRDDDLRRGRELEEARGGVK
jgi:hypothetical protein